VDLAKTLIRLSGKTEEEIPIVFTGLRPGEKLHESLFYDFEKRTRTAVSKVMRAQSLQMNWFYLQRGLRELEAAMRANDEYRLRCAVKDLIPEYQWAPARISQMQLITHRRHGAEARHLETIRPIPPAPVWIEGTQDHDGSNRAVHEA